MSLNPRVDRLYGPQLGMGVGIHPRCLFLLEDASEYQTRPSLLHGTLSSDMTGQSGSTRRPQRVAML